MISLRWRDDEALAYARPEVACLVCCFHASVRICLERGSEEARQSAVPA